MIITIPKNVVHYIIGLWRFHEAGKPRLWCITYRWRGCYYDVQGCKTPEEALVEMCRALARLRRKR